MRLEVFLLGALQMSLVLLLLVLVQGHCNSITQNYDASRCPWGRSSPPNLRELLSLHFKTLIKVIKPNSLCSLLYLFFNLEKFSKQSASKRQQIMELEYGAPVMW